MYRSYQPHSLLVDAPILVCEHMSLCNDSLLRDVCMSCLEGIRDFTSRFANNVDQAFDGALEDGVLHVLFKADRSDELLRLVRCLQHVPQLGRVTAIPGEP